MIFFRRCINLLYQRRIHGGREAFPYSQSALGKALKTSLFGSLLNQRPPKIMLCHPKAPLFWVSDQKLQMYHLRSHILEFLIENDKFVSKMHFFFLFFFYKFQYKFMKKIQFAWNFVTKRPFFCVQFPLLTQRSLFFLIFASPNAPLIH